MEDNAKRILEWGLDRWHSASGLAAVLAGTAGASIVILTGVSVANLSWREWLGIAVLLAAVCVIWWRTHIRRVSAKRVGFGVAIVIDRSENSNLRADFVDTLKQLLSESRLKRPFEFVEFSQTLSARVATDDQAAIWLAGKANLTFLIYGRARLREANGTQSHVLDLKWAVRHAPIPLEQSTRLQSDADALFPRRWIFAAGNLFSCEFAAQFVDAVARYVIGSAALASSEHEYAEQMLLEAERRLDLKVNNSSSTKAVVLNRVRAKIAENYWEWAQTYIVRYTFRTRDKSELAAAEPILTRLRNYDPDNYSARQSSAMIAFLLRRDLTAAKAEVERSRGESDATWRYNEAFLCAYEGDLEAAYRSYSRAFEAPLGESSVPTQSEEFIQIIIDEEPERGWLYFCTGIINYRAKGDLIAARNDLRLFQQKADPVRFGRQLEAVARWLPDIEAKLRDGANGV